MENVLTYQRYPYRIYQIAFIIVGICILFYLCYLIYRKHTAIIEPGDPVMDIVEKIVDIITYPIFKMIQFVFSDFLDPVIDFLTSLPKRVKNIGNGLSHFTYSFKQAFDVLGAELDAGFEGIGNSFIQSYRLTAAELHEETINNIGKGLEEIEEVLYSDKNKGMTKLALSINKLLLDVKYVYKYVETFIFTYIFGYVECGFTKILNFPKCVIFYIIDILVGVFFILPVKFLLFLLNQLFHVDGESYLDYGYGIIEKTDEAIRPFLGGYSIIHYSPSIMDACYECNLTPMPESPIQLYKDDLETIHDTLADTPEYISKAIKRITYGVYRIPSALGDGFSLLGHQLKASLEQLGQAFPDSGHVLKVQEDDVGHDIAAQFKLTGYDDLRWKDKDFSAEVDVPYYYKKINENAT